MCIACETQSAAVSTQESGNFLERLLGIMNSANLSMMLSIGHRTGLLNALQKAGPSTSAGLAEQAGLNERYVREWLGAMTTGRVVDCDETGTVFSLPEAHAALLTDVEGSNFAYITQFISVLGTVEDRVVDCFYKGGGVPYAAYPRFHEVMAQDSAVNVVARLHDAILPLAPGIHEKLSTGINVLDVGCGKGRALLKLAERYPNSQFTGYDLCPEPIAAAQEAADQKGLKNIRFEIRDLSHFHLDAPEAEYDFVTAFDAVHDQARPDHLLLGIRRTIKDDGLFLMQDIGASSNVAENRDHPVGAMLYTVSCMHCMTVSLAQGGLGVGTMWGEQLTRQYLATAGFSQVNRHKLEHDILNYYYVAYPDKSE